MAFDTIQRRTNVAELPASRRRNRYRRERNRRGRNKFFLTVLLNKQGHMFIFTQQIKTTLSIATVFFMEDVGRLYENG